jgi:hypothetical protein
MAPTITNTNVSQLTKDAIADLYFQSLGAAGTKKNHSGLQPTSRSGTLKTPWGAAELGEDFGCWYDGFLGCAKVADPGADLPPMAEMGNYITHNFERAKAAIAA